MPDPFGGEAGTPGNIGSMTPQQLELYRRMLDQNRKSGFTPSHSWADIPAGILEGLAEKRDQDRMFDLLGRSLLGQNQETQAFSNAFGGGGNDTGSGALPDNHTADRPTGYTTKMSDDPALQAGMTISARGETGAAHPSTLGNISPDTNGSKSYGWWGLNDKSGSLGEFVKANPQLGLSGKYGTPEFDASWKKVAAENPKGMAEAHAHYYTDRIMGNADKDLAGIDPAIAKDNRVRVYMADRRLQMGNVGLQRSLGAAANAKTPDDFLKTVSASDRANVQNDFKSYLRDRPENVRGLNNRINQRYAESDFATRSQQPTMTSAGPSQPTPGTAPAPTPQSSPSAQPGAGAGQDFIPGAPGAKEGHVARLKQLNAALFATRPGTPERQRVEQAITDEYKATLPTEKMVNGRRYFGNDLTGGFYHSPGLDVPSPAEEAGMKETASELGKARVKPVAQAIDKGMAASQVIRDLDSLMAVSNLPEAKGITSGPFAELSSRVKSALRNYGLGEFPEVAPAEVIQKLNAQLASASVHELTQRGTQFDFKTFMQNNPGIEQTPEGRQMTADILRQMATQDQIVGRRAMKLKDPSDFYDMQEQVYKENPIIVHFRGQAIDSTKSLPGYAPPEGGGSSANPPKNLMGENAPRPTPSPFANADALVKALTGNNSNPPASSAPALAAALAGPSSQSLMRNTVRGIGPTPAERGNAALMAGAHEPTPEELAVGAAAPFMGAPALGVGRAAAPLVAKGVKKAPDWALGGGIFELWHRLLEGGH